MSAPAGIIHYGNIPIDSIRGGNITVTHSITPNVATIYCAPFSQQIAFQGLLQIRYGTSTIRFPDCMLADVSYETQQDGFQVMVVRILDRRWKWAFGWIRGQYNYRQAENQVRPTREKTPRELAALCLREMGESRFDVSQLPDDSRPFVDWDGNPAEALANLCESLGCRVILNPANNLTTIVKVGTGRPLPFNNRIISDTLNLDPPELPDEIRFLAGQSLWQVDLELEAVMEEPEPSRELKLADDVSYRPSNGWEHETAECHNVVPKHRELAKSQWRKLYRIKTPFEVEWWDQGEIKSLERILPIESEQLETRVTATVNRQPIRERVDSYVFGDYRDGSQDGRAATKFLHTAHGLKALFTRGHTIDRERGTVMLSEPLYQWADQNRRPLPDAGTILAADQILNVPAKLWLRTAIGVRDENTWAWHRQDVTYAPSGRTANTKSLIIARTDIALHSMKRFTRSGAQLNSNWQRVQDEARHYIDRKLQELQIRAPGSRRYAGIELIPLDGAIHQVTWEIDVSGHAYTTASHNREAIHLDMTYHEKRQQEKLSQLLREEKQNQNERGRNRRNSA